MATRVPPSSKGCKIVSIPIPTSWEEEAERVAACKIRNFTYTFSDLELLSPRRGEGRVSILYKSKIKDDYDRIQRLAIRFANILMSHTFLPWDEGITILARKADEWLVELEKLEANMLWAEVCAGAKIRGIEPGRVRAGGFRFWLTGSGNSGEGRCSWHLESPDGIIVQSGDERSPETAA
ncbi:MAG: hypothetical protein Q9207_004206 [Kuettlingeria erythrocarpa]